MKVFLPIFTTAYASFVILQKVSSYDGALMWSLVAALPVNILISFILGRLQFWRTGPYQPAQCRADRHCSGAYQ